MRTDVKKLIPSAKDAQRELDLDEALVIKTIIKRRSTMEKDLILVFDNEQEKEVVERAVKWGIGSLSTLDLSILGNILSQSRLFSRNVHMAEFGRYGKYRLTVEEIFHKIERWKLTGYQKAAIRLCLENNQVIFVTGPHGPTGKTSLVDRLIDLGLFAKELDIHDVVIMDKPLDKVHTIK